MGVKHTIDRYPQITSRCATYSTVDGKSAIGTNSHGPLCYIGNKN